MMTMDAAEESHLDTEFDQMLVEMRPHVLRLAHKSERQKCAVWIKKFCEPPAPGVIGRKNRNAYTRLLVHMLKKGLLEGPFTDKPEPGVLPTLPSYMSIYFDDAGMIDSDGGQNRVPDWVAGELASELSSMPTIDSIDSPTIRFQAAQQRFAAALEEPSPTDFTRRKTYFPREANARSPSPTTSRSRERKRHPSYEKLDDEELDFLDTPGLSTSFESDDTSLKFEKLRPFKSKEPTVTEGCSPLSLPVVSSNMEWASDTHYSSLQTTGGNSLFKDESTLPRVPGGREAEMQKKMLEAKFQEDKLRLQQKHDSNVQKILDRKNMELEDLKRHYRTKSKEQEEITSKLERKLSHIQKELTATREAREQETHDLKKLLEESSATKQHELDRRISEVQSQYEEEKFVLQKHHTKNIQELLDDTNSRLTKMEGEYNQQIDATSAVIRELEARVQQLGSDADSLTKIRNQLEREKIELEGHVDRLQADNMAHQDKCIQLEKEIKILKEDNEMDVRTSKNKHEASIDFMKQEHALASAKEYVTQLKQALGGCETSSAHVVRAHDRIGDLEQQVAQLKQAVDNSEQQRQNQLREMEQSYLQDKIHLENLHDKKIRNMQQEFDQLEQDYQKKLRKMEQTVREKEDELCRLLENQKHQSVQSEQALENFKTQVERNSSKMYSDMKAQMEKVEQDLHRSKQLREKQAKEAQRLLEEEKHRQPKQLAEKQLINDQEKSTMLRDFHIEKEVWYSEKEHEVETMKEAMKADMTALEHRTREKQDKDAKTINELGRQLQLLRDELVQANSLRKQQLMELGMLREDEKQRMDREQDTMVSKLRSELEQQKFSAEKKHNADMEEIIEKTNVRLKEIEIEYSTRAEKANETITALQNAIKELKNTMNRKQEEAEHEITMTTTRLEDEKRRLKQRHANAVMTLQQEFETQKSRNRQSERQLHMTEQDYEEKLISTRTQYEEQLRGLVSASVRQELEDTISSLRQQVALLQQRASVLQEDLDQRNSICDRSATSNGSLQHQLLGAGFGDSINTITSSIKSSA